MSVASSLRVCDVTKPRGIAQPGKRLHDATVTGGTLVDRLPLPTRCVEAMTGVGRQLIAELRSDGTASSHAARAEAARRNRGRRRDRGSVAIAAASC